MILNFKNMLNLLNNKCRPIGLDIGRNSIKMIQLEIDNDRFRVVAADKAILNYSDNTAQQRSAITSALKEILEKNKFKGNSVVSCLSNEELKIKSLRIDIEEQENIEEILRTDVAQRFGLNPEEDEIEYMVAGNVQQGDELKSELLVFAVDKQAIRSHIELLEEIGLDPVSIDTVPCALFRSFERILRRQEDKDVVNVFVDLGSHFTTVVVGRGSDISFVKQIPLGGEKFNAEIGSKLGLEVSQACTLRRRLNTGSDIVTIDEVTKQAILDAMQGTIEQLAKEISLCFRYYSVTFRGSRPGRVYFSGGEAYEKTLVDALRSQLAVDIEIAQPLKGFDLSNINFNDAPRRPYVRMGHCRWFEFKRN